MLCSSQGDFVKPIVNHLVVHAVILVPHFYIKQEWTFWTKGNDELSNYRLRFPQSARILTRVTLCCDSIWISTVAVEITTSSRYFYTCNAPSRKSPFPNSPFFRLHFAHFSLCRFAQFFRCFWPLGIRSR